jgi:UDP-2-acetamido-3-amino-2,3-dideoxy-glucuronate N-acetyltransferase
MIHKLADVQSKKIGSNTYVWQFSIILPGATLGNNCNVNCHVFIENDVHIGNYVTIKSGVYLWDGIEIEDHVFVGPNVTFTNDPRPRSKKTPAKFSKVIIQRNASIGAGSVILGGVTIGEYSMVGAGALVTNNVPARSLVIGAPARVVAWLNEDGSKMDFDEDIFVDNNGDKWVVRNGVLIKN